MSDLQHGTNGARLRHVGLFPASDRCEVVTSNGYQAGKDLAHWKAKMFDNWYDIKIQSVDVAAPEDIEVNRSIPVKALLQLGDLAPTDIRVELYLGPVDAHGKIIILPPQHDELSGSRRSR